MVHSLVSILLFFFWGAVLAAGSCARGISASGCDDAVDQQVMRALMRQGVQSSWLYCAQNDQAIHNIHRIREQIAGNSKLTRCQRAAYGHWLDFFQFDWQMNNRGCAEDARRRSYEMAHPLPSLGKD